VSDSEWEVVTQDGNNHWEWTTQRLGVPGGWIYSKTTQWVSINDGESKQTESCVFVPSPQPCAACAVRGDGVSYSELHAKPQKGEDYVTANGAGHFLAMRPCRNAAGELTGYAVARPDDRNGAAIFETAAGAAIAAFLTDEELAPIRDKARAGSRAIAADEVEAVIPRLPK
jgi:hypothetical protein